MSTYTNFDIPINFNWAEQGFVSLSHVYPPLPDFEHTAPACLHLPMH